jgi:hypothetical protein
MRYSFQFISQIPLFLLAHSSLEYFGDKSEHSNPLHFFGEMNSPRFVSSPDPSSSLHPHHLNSSIPVRTVSSLSTPRSPFSSISPYTTTLQPSICSVILSQYIPDVQNIHFENFIPLVLDLHYISYNPIVKLMLLSFLSDLFNCSPSSFSSDLLKEMILFGWIIDLKNDNSFIK